MRSKVETWFTTTTIPYRARNVLTDRRDYYANGSRAWRTERKYDLTGNVTVAKDFGRQDKSGDEASVKHDFVYNSAAYVMDRPFVTRTYATTTEAEFDDSKARRPNCTGSTPSITSPAK